MNDPRQYELLIRKAQTRLPRPTVLPKMKPLTSLPPPDYTPEEIETLKRIVEFNKSISDSIEKIGWDATGAAMLIAFFKAMDQPD